jgi:hypothetical protein
MSRISFSCKRVLYDGTAPEQKTENAKRVADSMSATLFINPSSVSLTAATFPPEGKARFGHLFIRRVYAFFRQSQAALFLYRAAL